MSAAAKRDFSRTDIKRGILSESLLFSDMALKGKKMPLIGIFFFQQFLFKNDLAVLFPASANSSIRMTDEFPEDVFILFRFRFSQKLHVRI